ncbi:MAG: hypothetical protein ACR2NN_14205 [Bryobacteraceae bacterium]
MPLLLLLTGLACASAALLLARGVFGPFDLIWPVHNPLNLECALALAILLSLLARSVRAHAPLYARPFAAGAPVVVAVITAVAYLPILSMPLVTDDYIHLRQISSGQAPTPIECLTHSCGGPRFFRPLGFATYWAEQKLWNTAALPRHAFDLALHVASSVLFLMLVRRLGMPPPLDWLAGLLFALNGLFPEAVAWTAARFDMLALLFSLIAALAVARGTGVYALAVSLAATMCACLSKESGFVLPVLLVLLLGRRVRTRDGKVLAISNFTLAAAIFTWRWLVLKGIGGYQEATGAPTVFEFDGIKLAKTFLARIWGVLWIPVNWSRPLEFWMMLGLAAGLLGSLAMLKARPDRRPLLLTMVGVVVACIPTHHMLLIGPSLERSRYLTYALPAFVLLIVNACRALPRWMGPAALCLLAAFHLAALQHNLRIWRSVASARYELCRGVAAVARTTGGTVSIEGLPLTLDGVYWSNGLEDCLALEFGVPMGKVWVNSPDPAGASLRLHWDASERALR